MKSIAKFATVIVTLAFLLAAGSAFAQAKFHIGIVTGTVSPVGGRPARCRAADQGVRFRQGRRHDPAHHLSRRLHVAAGDLHLLRRLACRRPAHEGHRRQPGHPRHDRGHQARQDQEARHPLLRRRSPRGPARHPASGADLVAQQRLRGPRLHHRLGRQAARRQDLRPHFLPPAHVVRDHEPPLGHHGGRPARTSA